MLLIIYGLLAIVPLLGIGWILTRGSITTVDGLFMSLICAAISAIFAATAFFELRSGGPGSKAMGPVKSPVRAGAAAGNSSGAHKEHGRVESVLFYESSVGQPNTSIVTLSNGPASSKWLVFEGDLRNALPVGKRVEIVSREDEGRKVLLDVQYR
jgi:hypothetical protein